MSEAILSRRHLQLADSPYAERADVDETNLDRSLAAWQARAALWLRHLSHPGKRFTDRVDALGNRLRELDDEALRAEARWLARELRRRSFAEETVSAAFALVREQSHRTLGMRHHREQVMGGLALIRGRLAEMNTGEGKTLTATLAAGTAALAGLPVHVVTVNEYLATRDAEEMGPLYRSLGLTVGVAQQGQSPAERRAAYAADITYCTNKDLGFDYLRDRIRLKDWPSEARIHLAQTLTGDDARAELILRGLHFAIVDEADSVLIDEARTPLIISREVPGPYQPEVLRAALDIVQRLQAKRDFELSTRHRLVRLNPKGRSRLRDLVVGTVLERLPAPLVAELATQSLSARHLYLRDQHYLVQDGKVQIIDEYTGRLMPDRSWELGLHQLIEVKEDCAPTQNRETLARITYQRFFRRYLHLSGMSGTAMEVAPELWAVYRLKVERIPTHRPERRSVQPARILRSQDAKWREVIQAVQAIAPRPVLIGTRSVEASERLSAYLTHAGIAHRVLNARQDAEEAQLVAQAGQSGQVTVATNMAGRGTDIKLPRAVAEAGGLHVILTEFHESKRIDRQLFGRCGRQGEPGSCQALVALDDDLFTTYAPAWYRALAASGKLPGLAADLVHWAVQSRAERHHARIRKHTLETDRHVERLVAFAGRE